MVCTMFGYFSFSNLKAFQGWSIKLKLNWLCLQPPWALALRAMGWNIEFFLLLLVCSIDFSATGRDVSSELADGRWQEAAHQQKHEFNSIARNRRAALLRRLHAITVRHTAAAPGSVNFSSSFRIRSIIIIMSSTRFRSHQMNIKRNFLSLSISISFDWLPPNGTERWKHISIQLRSRTHHYYASSHLHYF